MTEVRKCSAEARVVSHDRRQDSQWQSTLFLRRSPSIVQTLLSWSIVHLGLINQVN
jgi:hypothetical protein